MAPLPLILILILVGSTLQLAVMKNNLDRLWNNRFGYRLGNYCFLCVSFWLNVVLVVLLYTESDLSITSILLAIFAVPAGVLYIVNRIENGD